MYVSSRALDKFFYYCVKLKRKKWEFKKYSLFKSNRLKYNFIFNNNKGFNCQGYLAPSQTSILFIKRKFGLYKIKTIFDKKTKKKLLFIKNFITKKVQQFKIKKRVRILYYKRMKKLYYRAGRSVLIKHLKLKKYIIQRDISRRITTFLKKDILLLLREVRLCTVLTKSSIFLSEQDSKNFIEKFGACINNTYIYNPNYCLKAGDVFKLVSTKILLKYLQTKRKYILVNIKKIKFYNYRSKLFFFKKKYMWVPSTEWIENHMFLYTNRYNNIEFDPKILTGFYLYDLDGLNTINFYKKLDLSLYMIRSYNWKYIV